MLAVPVHAAIEPHVETDQDQLCSTTLHGEVDRLETGIAAVAEHAWRLDQDLVAAARNTDLAQAWKGQAGRSIMR